MYKPQRPPTQHGEDLYQRYAEVLQLELLKISENVSINQFDMRLTKVLRSGTSMMLFTDLILRWKGWRNYVRPPKKEIRTTDYRGFKVIPVGAFEVYFMGLKLHSKIMSMQWPRISALVGIC